MQKQSGSQTIGPFFHIGLIKGGENNLVQPQTAGEPILIKGVVREAAKFPLPQRWYQAPIEYEVFVDIVEDNPLIKSGLRAKSRIIVDRQENVRRIFRSEFARRWCALKQGYAGPAIRSGIKL